MRDVPRYEVLMVQRPKTSRFMPSIWVFPGGAVDDADTDPPRPFGAADDWRVAALRELIEETGIWLTEEGALGRKPTQNAFSAVREANIQLHADALVYFDNWITPEALPLRFDTRFFLAFIGGAVEGEVDGEELVDLMWIEPVEAIERADDGLLDVAFPTLRTLELLASRRSASEIERELRGRTEVAAREPRLLVEEDSVRIVLPGEPGFDEIGPSQKDPDLLAKLADVIRRGGRVPPELRRKR